VRKLVLLFCVFAVMSVSAGAYASATNWVILVKASTANYARGGSATVVGAYITGQNPTTAQWPDISGISVSAVRVGDTYDSKYIASLGSQLTFDLKIGARNEYPDSTQRITLWNTAQDAADRDTSLDTSLVYTLYQGTTLKAWFTTPQHEDVWPYMFLDRALWHDVSDLLQVKGWNPGAADTGFYLDVPVVKGANYDALADYSLSATPYMVEHMDTPEPGSLLILGSGLIAMAGFTIRRRRA
jgi:hypothetical protein